MTFNNQLNSPQGKDDRRPAEIVGSPSRYDRPAAYSGPVVYEGEAVIHNVSFVDSVLKYKWVIVGATILGGLLAFALTLPQKRIYRAHVSLEFAGLNDNVLNTRDVDPAATGDNSSQAYINTQARVLESAPLLEQVVAKVKKEAAAHKGSNSASRNAALEALSAASLGYALDIRPMEGTKLIDVFVQSTDPDLAAELANTLANEFITQSVEERWTASQRTSGWLAKQLEEVKAKLESSESALQDYARRTNLVFEGGEDGSVSEARLRQVQDEYSRAQADRMAKQSIYEGLLAEKPEDETAALRDPALQDYQNKLSDLNRQLADLSTVYKPTYEKVERLHSQIQELKKDYARQHDQAVARVKNDFETAKRREDMLDHSYRAQQGVVTQEAAKTVDYNILKREADTNRSIYEAMLQRVKSYGIASAMQPSNIRVVDPAQKPLFPSKPNVPMTTLFGMLGSLSLALVWVAIRQNGEVMVEYPGQTRQALNIPELGVIPAARLDPLLAGSAASWRRLPAARANIDTDLADQVVAPRSAVETASWHHKSSLLAESVRSIRTSMLYGNGVDAPKIVVVSSLGPSHGKTSFVSNMGIAMAELGRRTLIVDADLRRPTLHTAFGLDNKPGLTDVLNSSTGNDGPAPIQRTAVPNLSLLASGAWSEGSTSSSNLFHSDRMIELLNRLRPAYDTILIDTPPLTLTDARILGPHSDGVVLVLRAGEVKMESVFAAESRLSEDGSRVIGTVLNHWNPKSNGYGAYPDRYYTSSYSANRK